MFDGNCPARPLLPKLKYLSEDTLYRGKGTCPDKLFKLRSSSRRFEMCCELSGIGPVSIFWPSNTKRREETFPMERGMLPENKFSATQRYLRDITLSNGGIVPTKEFLWRSTVVSVDLLKNRVSGIPPARLLRERISVLSEELLANERGICSLFAWLISHQPAVLFSQNKQATNNQPTVLFSQNKPAPAISHQPTEQADDQ
jgi:hypothetical protein